MKVQVAPKKVEGGTIITLKIPEAMEVGETTEGITRITLSKKMTLELLDAAGIQYIINIKRVGNIKM